MNQNNSTLVWLVAAGAGLLIWIGVNEYREVKSSAYDFQVKIEDAVDETTLLVQSIRKTINDLREKISFLETQHQALESKLAEASKAPAKEESKPAPVVRRLVVHTTPNCGACNVWKTQHMADWQANGFEVQFVEESIVGYTYPWFEITDKNKQRRIEGVLSWKTYQELR